MTNGASYRFDSWRSLELIAIFVLVLSVTGLVAARLGVFHAPQIWIIGLLLTFAYDRSTKTLSVTNSDCAPFWHLLLVLGVGLLFRLTPYAYILGGQDQGVYVNMAMELVRTGALEPVDLVLKAIADPSITESYLQGNYNPTIYLPGVYSTAGGLEFQFYHLFPVWLALFADLMGVEGAGYGLTLLSLVSLLFFQRLAHLISGRASVGLVAGLLLAVNPLHAFFSKFPVTEVPTLAFSAMSFAFLVGYWRAPEAAGARRLLAISVSALGMLFMTRISGFMYLPFVLVLSVAVAMFELDPDRRRGVLVWSVAVVMLYAFSVMDGLRWSSVYATDIYRLSFAPLLGDRWRAWLMLLALGALLGWIAAWNLRARESVRLIGQKLLLFGAGSLPVLALVLAALAAYKAYRLGFTDGYAADPWIGERFGLSGQGYRSVFSTSLVASATYLSPFVLLAYFAIGFRAAHRPLLCALLFFVFCFLGYVAVLQWNLPYQPYYARYLLSEFVPYVLLLVVCTWAEMGPGKFKATVAGALLLGGLYGMTLSALQIGKNEHEGVVDSLSRAISRIDDGDLVIVDRGLRTPSAYEIKTSFVFTYGLNVATMAAADLANQTYFSGLSRPFHDVYFVTQDPIPPRGFTASDSVHFVEQAFQHGVQPPVATWRRGDSELFVHRYSGETRDVAAHFRFGAGQAGNALLGTGWSAPESWGIWTNSEAARLRLNPDTLAAGCMQQPALRLFGRAYVTAKSPRQRYRLLVDGVTVARAEVKIPKTVIHLVAQLPEEALFSDAIEIVVETPDAVAPSVLGYSNDTRRLGFGLERLEIYDQERNKCR